MVPVIGDTSTILDENCIVLLVKDALKIDAYAANALVGACGLKPQSLLRLFLCSKGMDDNC